VKIKRQFKLWPTIPSISTKRTITQKDTKRHKKTQYISVFVITFTFEILGIQKTKVPSQGSQTCLRAPMPGRVDPYIWYIRRVWRYQRSNHNP